MNRFSISALHLYFIYNISFLKWTFLQFALPVLVFVQACTKLKYSSESKFLCFILCPYPRPAPSPSPTVQPMTVEEAAHYCSDQWLIQHGRCGHCSFSRGQTGAIILNSQLDSLLTARALLMEKQRSAILFYFF